MLNKMEDEVVATSNGLHSGDVEWQPLSLTLVEYPKGICSLVFILLDKCPPGINNSRSFYFLGDLLGKVFAFLSLSPFGIGAGFVTLILFRRDLHTVSTLTLVFRHLYQINRLESLCLNFNSYHSSM